MPETTLENRPGFQGSETSRVEVDIYQHGDDPVVLYSDGGLYNLHGRRASDPSHCVVGVQTSKTLGAGSGQFSITIKPSKVAEAIFQWLVDDDWVDLVFYRHDQPWHVMRGLVDEVRRSKIVGGTGATSEVYTITGRDFTKIWEMTPVWFSPYANNDLVTDAVAHKVFEAIPSVAGAPDVSVPAYLKSFLEEIAKSAGVNWNPPSGMPTITDNSFLQSVKFWNANYQNKPSRKQFNPNFMQPSGTLWQLAQQHSDPLFTELYADLLPEDGPLSARLASGEPMDLGEMFMTVVIRDKPFPVSDAGDFIDSWADLPMAIIPKQQVISSDLGRGGAERFNTYFVASLLHQEQTTKDSLSIITPLVNLEEIKRHGMRRMDVQSQMAPDKLDFGVMATQQRKIIRDWYALNPYMISGTLSLGVGRPDIRVGMRVRVPGVADDASDDETYYVENVNHQWQFRMGTRTTLGVTRGWIGDDASYLEKLDSVVAKYVVPKLRKDS